MAAIKSDTSVLLTQQMDRKQLLCRFHIRGSCRDGEWCQFSHDTNQSVPIPETVCWYYLQSHCMYGDNCRFVHLDASSILTNHQLSQQEPQIRSNNSLISSSLPQQLSQQQFSPQSLQTIAHNNSTNNNSYNKNNSCNDNNNTNTNTSNNQNNRPVLVPFNKFSPQLSSVLTSQQSITNPNQALNISSLPSLVTDSRQSSEDSGYNEPTSSSCNISSTSASSNSSGSKTYAQVMSSINDLSNQRTNNLIPSLVVYNNDTPLCPYATANIDGLCPYSDGQCHYLHGDICDLCGRSCLHPNDVEQQKQHRDECIKEHEREMEISFAVQRSLDKACGICMDIVIEKEPITERRFGILEKCSHIFCLSCIRKWRQTKQFDNRTIRACPECRVPSDFVIPSKYWYDERSEKQSLIDSYKKALSTKPCKYFKQGQGECPFAGACFYLHAYPDGRKAEMPPPRARRRQNHDGELETLRDMLLWNYLEVRDDNHWLLTLDLEDVFDIHEMGLLSGYETDDESDLSDYADNLIG